MLPSSADQTSAVDKGSHIAVCSGCVDISGVVLKQLQASPTAGHLHDHFKLGSACPNMHIPLKLLHFQFTLPPQG